MENLRNAFPRASWSRQKFRLENTIDWILETLSTEGTKATFFILGWTAEKLPHIVQRIAAEKHELASHGYNHELIPHLTSSEFKADVERSKKFIEDLTGKAVLGYRAPSFSITDEAIDVLIDLSFTYDSSLFPTVMHEHYGKLTRYLVQSAPVFEMKKGFYQIRMSYLPFLGLKFPWAGGGYFRLYPYTLFKAGVKRIAKSQKVFNFYIHPWEFDSGQPRVKNIGRLSKFRHYNNLSRTRTRFSNLIKSFPFEPLVSVLLLENQR